MNLNDFNILLSLILFILMIVNIFFKTKERFLIVLFNLMNSIGAIFYVFGGDLYKKPSDEALFYMLLILITINIIYIFYYFLFYFNKNKIYYEVDNILTRSLKWDKIILLIPFFFLPFFYFLIFYNKFPIYYMLLGEAIGESARPDVSGSLPHFYSFTVFLSSFTFPFLIYLYFRVKKNIFKILIFMFMIFFAFLIGDKSTLMVLIFYIYLYKNKVNFLKVLLFSIFFVGFYVLMKFLYYEALKYADISALFESIFRRVCVIQPSAFGTYLDYFVIDDNTIPNGFRHIKQFLFYLIYGYQEGGLSVIFPGSFLDYIGIGIFQIVLVGEVFLIILIIRYFILKIKYKLFREMIEYLHFYGAILLAQGFISDLIVRWFFPVLFIIFLDMVLYKIFYKKKVKNAIVY